ncbi:hypothetical protein NC651_012546 [Populus alba x Populus x berolinensis]|nr:hypothetical protein NC651_012546 [Populus alba x Populus x berolinensis]
MDVFFYKVNCFLMRWDVSWSEGILKQRPIYML